MPGHARRKNQLFGPQHDRLPFAFNGHRPVPRVCVILGAAADRGMPIVQFHDLGVHLQPIADLVLRGEDRPMVGKRQVRQVVVPHGVVQAERFIAVPPRIAGATVLFDDDRRHVQALEPGRQADAALSAADDDAIGLSGRSPVPPLPALLFQPGLSIFDDAVLRSQTASRPRVSPRIP